MKKFFEDFKAFAMRGNVIDMAVGVIIGAAFGSITTSLVNDIFMPLIGVLTGGINFGGLFVALDGGSYVSAEAAAAAGVGTINYGLFIQNVINFILLMLANGVDLKTLQEVLGHENLNTTQIYTHIENTDKKIAAEANPLSKLKI